MQGDFDEDEWNDDDEDYEPDEDDICADCQRIGTHYEPCGVCGMLMCFACFEMGCGVCMGPHR